MRSITTETTLLKEIKTTYVIYFFLLRGGFILEHFVSDIGGGHSARGGPAIR